MAKVTQFGLFDGKPVHRYELTNGSGMTASIIDWGATLQALSAPIGGENRNLVLGFDQFDDYPARSPYFGATCGRVGNRIADGRFLLDGVEYTLPVNEVGNAHLHGGPTGLTKRVWALESHDERSVTLSIRSPDGEEGYPGNLDAICRYRLADDNALEIEMSGRCDRATPLNMVHHTYWNLDGSGSIDAHHLQVDADAFLPSDDAQIPTGEMASLDGSALDFRRAKRVDEVPESRIDHAFVLVPADGFRRVAELVSGDGLCRMTLFADQPAVQVYTGYKMNITASGGRRFEPRSGICLETEGFPDAPNHPNFPSIILRPGETYLHRMRHEFAFG
ncbi:MAG: aldose epimerase family protein [Geminicoccaceae bacterium]